MIKYLTIPRTLVREKFFTAQQKLFISLLVVLTKKGTSYTTVSDQYLANELGLTTSYTSILLGKFKKLGIIKTRRELGRRIIEMDNTSSLIYKHQKK